MNPRIERKITRISGVREVKQTFLIICEGVNTEPDYFNAFRLTSATVESYRSRHGDISISTESYQYKRAGKAKRKDIQSELGGL